MVVPLAFRCASHRFLAVAAGPHRTGSGAKTARPEEKRKRQRDRHACRVHGVGDQHARLAGQSREECMTMKWPRPVGYGGGINLYAYVGNDPLNQTDRRGTASDSFNWAQTAYTQRPLQAAPISAEQLSQPRDIGPSPALLVWKRRKAGQLLLAQMVHMLLLMTSPTCPPLKLNHCFNCPTPLPGL